MTKKSQYCKECGKLIGTRNPNKTGLCDSCQNKYGNRKLREKEKKKSLPIRKREGLGKK